MNAAIDTLAADYFLLSLSDASAINLCDKSRDYFYAAVIWQMLCGVINISKEDSEDESKITGKFLLMVRLYKKVHQQPGQELLVIILLNRN
jgi:hypothetical protein